LENLRAAVVAVAGQTPDTKAWKMACVFTHVPDRIESDNQQNNQPTHTLLWAAHQHLLLLVMTLQ
jgi:hypothetical protein